MIVINEIGKRTVKVPVSLSYPGNGLSGKQFPFVASPSQVQGCLRSSVKRRLATRNAEARGRSGGRVASMLAMSEARDRPVLISSSTAQNSGSNAMLVRWRERVKLRLIRSVTVNFLTQANVSQLDKGPFRGLGHHWGVVAHQGFEKRQLGHVA